MDGEPQKLRLHIDLYEASYGPAGYVWTLMVGPAVQHLKSTKLRKFCLSRAPPGKLLQYNDIEVSAPTEPSLQARFLIAEIEDMVAIHYIIKETAHYYTIGEDCDLAETSKWWVKEILEEQELHGKCLGRRAAFSNLEDECGTIADSEKRKRRWMPREEAEVPIYSLIVGDGPPEPHSITFRITGPDSE